MIFFGYKNKFSCILRAVLAITAGIFLLFFFNSAVAKIIVSLIGVAILIFGVLQLLVVIGTMSLLGRGGSPILLSVVAIAGAILLIFNPFSERIMAVLAGCFLIYYGVSDILSLIRVTRARKAFEEKFGSKASQGGPFGGSSTRQSAERADEMYDRGPSRKVGSNSSLNDAKDVDYQKIDDQ